MLTLDDARAHLGSLSREELVELLCTGSLWMELAEARRAEHPEDTLVVYRQHVEDVIAAKNNRA
jgi:hypothetical protein